MGDWARAISWLLVALLTGVTAGAAAYKFGPYSSLNGDLKSTESLLTLTTSHLQDARQNAKDWRTRFEIVAKDLAASRQAYKGISESALLKERDIYVLRTCLGGVRESYYYALNRHYDTALSYLDSVRRECQAAWELLK